MPTPISRLVSAAVLGCTFASLSVTTLTAQRVVPVTLYSRPGSTGYNDCWGYTTPDKRDFAFLGDKDGIVLLETTDENNIQQKGFWRANRNLWRDFTNYKQYVYAVSEGHRGIRIIDMSNPDSPRDRGYVATGSISHTHNISIDPESGKLYLSGTNQGVAIFDAKANPLNPQFVGTWRNEYVHDVCARRERAYFAAGLSTACRIMDTSKSPTLSIVGSAWTPGGYCHNAWVSEDDQILCVTDEMPGSGLPPHLSIWDISNERRPVKLGDYVVGSISVHNVYMIGRVAYMSHYNDGFHMVDLADPTNPTRIGHFDTSGQTGMWLGNWGCYPFSDNGLVYASDMNRGLYVFKIKCGHMNRYGNGTIGSNGKMPQARFDGAAPRVNAQGLKFDIENLQPNAPFVFAISTGQGRTSMLGVEVNIDLARAKLFTLRADAEGKATIPAPIPNDPGLALARLYFQVVAEDRGNPNGFSASRGMWAGICK